MVSFRFFIDFDSRQSTRVCVFWHTCLIFVRPWSARVSLKVPWLMLALLLAPVWLLWNLFGSFFVSFWHRNLQQRERERERESKRERERENRSLTCIIKTPFSASLPPPPPPPPLLPPPAYRLRPTPFIQHEIGTTTPYSLSSSAPRRPQPSEWPRTICLASLGCQRLW